MEVNNVAPSWQAGRVSDDGLHEVTRTAPDVLDAGPAGLRVWLPLPDVAEALGIPVGKVRRMLQENALIALRRGERKILSVPAELIQDGEPLPDLQGTLILLKDSGFSEEETVRWLFTDDDYPGCPVDALRSRVGKTEVRRRAQALAF
jgi:Rv2175c C-terminal domain of unknown function